MANKVKQPRIINERLPRLRLAMTDKKRMNFQVKTLDKPQRICVRLRALRE